MTKSSFITGNTFKPCRKCGTKDFSPELKKGALAVLDDCKTQLDIIDKEKKSGSKCPLVVIT
jgi:hypothetical protein